MDLAVRPARAEVEGAAVDVGVLRGPLHRAALAGVEGVEDGPHVRPRVAGLENLDAAGVDVRAQREAGRRVELDGGREGRRTEAPAAVDRGLGGGQRGHRDAALDGVGEVGLDHPAQQSPADVAGGGGDVGDHPQRHRRAAGVERLVEARVGRDRHRPRAELVGGQPGAPRGHVVRAVVRHPVLELLLARAVVAEAAQHRRDPAAAPGDGLRRLVVQVEDGVLVVHGRQPSHGRVAPATG